MVRRPKARSETTKRRAARRRLARYRRRYGDDAYLFVPFGCLTREEQIVAVTAAAAFGARLALEAPELVRDAGCSTMPDDGVLRFVVEPLSRVALEWDLDIQAVIHDDDVAAWRRAVARRNGRRDPRAAAFCRVWEACAPASFS